MESIEVVCGIIINDKKVLVAQRSMFMTLPLKWEFPGGKKTKNETDEECLKRELLEELNIQVKVKQKFWSNSHKYPNFEIFLTAYFADIELGTILTFEHNRIEWFTKTELKALDWAAADIPIVNELLASVHL